MNKIPCASFTLLVLYLILHPCIWAQSDIRSTCTDSTIHDIRQSIIYYQDRLSQDSSDQISYYSIGMGFFKLQDYSSAIQYFDRLEILNPAYPSLYSNRGICKLLSGNKPGACSDFQKCLSLGDDPKIMDGQKLSKWVKKECPDKTHLPLPGDRG